MSSKSYKIVVIGAGGVGKSCFTIQLISGTFVETYDPTLEDSYRKQMTVDDEEAVLNIYDTAGQEDFSAVRDQYIRIGEGFICMYSITNDASFQEVSTLRDKLVDITEEEDHPVVLVGNKCDLEDDRQVQKAQAQSIADKYKWTWIEASAKNKINVTETFQEIVRCIRKDRNCAVSHDGDDKATEKPASARRRGGCLLL
jgi:GTPase KRas protein